MNEHVMRFRSSVLVVLLILVGLSDAQGQITVQGVYVDADGVLRHRRTVSSRRVRRTGEAEMIAVSLPRVLKQLRRHVEQETSVPEDIRFLKGLVRIDHIVVDDVRNDLALVGPSEAINAASEFRPVGRVTGRPVLQLDDVIVALRAFGPTARSRVFGCTLTHSNEGLKRVAALPRVTVLKPGQRDDKAARMKQALGPLQAKYFGIPADTRFAFVCIEADYRMKQFSIGLSSLPVPGMRNYLTRISGLEGYERFWFTDNYDAIEMTADRTQYWLRGPGLKILASSSPAGIVSTNQHAQEFAEEFTSHMADFEQAVPGFADLHNLVDLSVVASLIASDRLHEKIEWDLSWALSVEPYRPARVPCPRFAETLINTRRRGRTTVNVAGGVQMNLNRIISRMTEAKDARTTTTRLDFADDDAWWTTLPARADDGNRIGQPR